MLDGIHEIVEEDRSIGQATWYSGMFKLVQVYALSKHWRFTTYENPGAK